MRERADTVMVQSWTQTLTDGRQLPLRNILARFRPELSDRVLYLTHWDTRPVSDEAEDPAQRKLPMPGANDGASGVGLFIALGDALKKTPPSVGVDLLFVDGEDYGNFNTTQDVLMGSTYFASHLPSPGYRPIFGVLWDMIGDKDLQIKQEQISVQQAPEVVRKVWDLPGSKATTTYSSSSPRRTPSPFPHDNWSRRLRHVWHAGNLDLVLGSECRGAVRQRYPRSFQLTCSRRCTNSAGRFGDDYSVAVQHSG